MAFKITDDCINCGACLAVCPNGAIYEGGMGWRLSQGTNIKRSPYEPGLDVDRENHPERDDIFYIVREKCTECIGCYKTQQCANVCPVDCCIKDLIYPETQEELLRKKKFLHGE